MSECPAYGPDFLDEQVGLLPGPEVAATRGLIPVDDVGEAPLGQSSRGTGHLLWEHRAAGGHVDPVTDGVGEPRGDFVNALPVKPCRGGTGAREPVERDVVKHLLAAKHLEQITGMVRPRPQLLEYLRTEASR
jgi:hypothetical protein